MEISQSVKKSISRLTSWVAKSLLLGCAVLCLSSCQEKSEFPDESWGRLMPFTKTIDEINVQDGKLVFNDELQLQHTIIALLGMTESERNQWYANHNFTSLDQFYTQALDECSSFTFFEQYKVLRSKYSPYFIFNDEASEDLMPYLKTSETLHKVVLNKDGEVIINNKTVNYNNLTSYSQTLFATQYIQTKGIEQKDNFLKISNDKRIMWAEVKTIGNFVYIVLTAQVKSFWGWNNYKESYHSLLSAYADNFVLFPNTLFSTSPYTWAQTSVLPDNAACLLGQIQFRDVAPKVGETLPLVIHYNFYSHDMGSGEMGRLRIVKSPYLFSY